MHHRDTEGPPDGVTEAVMGAAIEVHRTLGPALLGSTYEEGPACELALRGILFERLEPIHTAQPPTDLRLSGPRVGLRMDFHAPRLKDGLRRPVLQGLRAFVVKGVQMRWMVLALAVIGPAEEPEAWVFFSPASPDAAALIRSFGDVPLRPVLLVEDYASGAEPSAAFAATLAASGPVRAADVDGLALAARLGIRELPAAAVRRGGRWHVAAGADLNGKELLRCSR